MTVACVCCAVPRDVVVIEEETSADTEGQMGHNFTHFQDIFHIPASPLHRVMHVVHSTQV